jgi:hypothetical protein
VAEEVRLRFGSLGMFRPCSAASATVGCFARGSFTDGHTLLVSILEYIAVLQAPYTSYRNRHMGHMSHANRIAHNHAARDSRQPVARPKLPKAVHCARTSRIVHAGVARLPRCRPTAYG